MAEYRVYCLDHEGMSLETRHLEASSNEEAVLKLSAYRDCANVRYGEQTGLSRR